MSSPHALLTRVRDDAIGRIATTAHEQTFTGVVGESGVGKSVLLGEAAGRLRGAWTVVWLDLDRVHSPHQLAWTWARELVRAVIDPVAFSHMSALDPSMWPGTTRQAIVDADRRLDHEVVRLAESPAPGRGVGTMDALSPLTRATVALASAQPVLLVIDHLEAPKAAGVRSPDAHDLLWLLRSVGQHEPGLHLLVCCRPPGQKIAVAEDAAYHLDGRWLTIRAPLPEEFARATGVSDSICALAHTLTGGHPNATLELLGEPEVGLSGSLEQPARRLAARHVDLAEQCRRHARAVHRLGGHLLAAVARGEGPYQATPELSAAEVSQAMTRLHLAGLIASPGRGRWRVSDPRVGWALDDVTLAARPIDKASPNARGSATEASETPAGGLDPQSLRSLTSRERDVLKLVLDGHTTNEIADTLGVTPATVSTHRGRAYRKLGVSSRAGALAARASRDY